MPTYCDHVHYTHCFLSYSLKAKFDKYLELEPMRTRILLEYAQLDIKEERALQLQKDIDEGLIPPPPDEPIPRQPKQASAITYTGQASKQRERAQRPLVRL